MKHFAEDRLSFGHPIKNDLEIVKKIFLIFKQGSGNNELPEVHALKQEVFKRFTTTLRLFKDSLGQILS